MHAQDQSRTGFIGQCREMPKSAVGSKVRKAGFVHVLRIHASRSEREIWFSPISTRSNGCFGDYRRVAAILVLRT